MGPSFQTVRGKCLSSMRDTRHQGQASTSRQALLASIWISTPILPNLAIQQVLKPKEAIPQEMVASEVLNG